MDSTQSRSLIRETFTQPFDKGRFRYFAINLLNHIDDSKAQAWNTTYVKDAFKRHVKGYERLGTYTSPEKEKLDVLVVHLTNESKLERARTAIRNFVADHLKTRDNKDAALVAFVSPTEKQWRFSYVKMEYATVEKSDGKVAVQTKLTPARRSSYIVGEGESCHTAQTRFLALLQDIENYPTLAQLDDAFNVEAVTKEFFNQYAKLFGEIDAALQKLAAKDKTIRSEFREKKVRTVDFAKKLMGQIVFLYFLQKKGWLGVSKEEDWGTGSHDFLRRLAHGDYGGYDNFFNDVLEPLFYDTLATDRGHEAWCNRFKCRIPFLNGGLFEPLADYDWRKTDIILPNKLFTNTEENGAGDIGTGILDVFNRYNFTVNEAEPLEKEVAIDPEMLGKVFENLIEDNRRKGLGSFYTPREIVHYMCQESLINYLDTALNKDKEIVPRKDIETLVHLGEQISYYEAVETKYAIKMPKSIELHARLIDEKLADMTICDPAVGSGAFPVGMMTEIVRGRCALTPYFNDVHDRTRYRFKRHAIQNSLYGVDIDPGAVEIAKLRLWLSLVVDEEDVKQIKPLPNLYYKIVEGNSLLGVEKTLFNAQAFSRLEELKPLYFDETDHARKAKLKGEISKLIHELTNGKEIFDFEIYFSEVFHRIHGFDVLLANPPYIGQKGHKEIFQEIARTDFGRKFHQRRMDLFYFFIHRALDLGRRQTQIAFITTNYFITATYADKLRKDLFERATFRSLINLNELRIFESALGQHNMVSLFEQGKDPDVSVLTATTKRVGFATPLVLNSIVAGHDPETEYRKVRQTDLYQGEQHYITLVGNHGSASDPKMAILDKVARNARLLGTLCNVFQGIVTGADKVSPKHISRFEIKASPGEGIFVLTAAELRALRLGKKELHYIRPLFKNSDIGRYWCSVDNSLHLIYRSSKHDENDLPAIKKHLERFKIILINRNVRAGEVTLSQYDDFVRGKGHIDYVMIASAMKAGNYCCISYARNEELFDGPKIVSPQRSYQNTFCFNDGPWYAASDVHYITPKDAYVSLKYILAIINSRLYFLWLYLKGKRKGEMLELVRKPLSEIPIKRISPNEQKPFIKLVDRILAAKQRDAEADTSALEGEIDRLVYKLYELTDDEIAIVEGSTRR
ncbi:MAG: Eco57I restriction-modification methylase domain-containing protein [Pyrinomonadaceae bacterium]|nr:Eco57I restriction-modification methylase domain-containing protein [Pyrinomonadaceae bacterium]